MKKLNLILKEKKICNLSLGESGYVIPWSAWRHIDGEYFINISYSVHPKKNGTVNNLLERTKEGYTLYLNESDLNFLESKSHSHVRYGDVRHIKVVFLDNQIKSQEIINQKELFLK